MQILGGLLHLQEAIPVALGDGCFRRKKAWPECFVVAKLQKEPDAIQGIVQLFQCGVGSNASGDLKKDAVRRSRQPAVGCSEQAVCGAAAEVEFRLATIFRWCSVVSSIIRCFACAIVVVPVNIQRGLRDRASEGFKTSPRALVALHLIPRAFCH